jgi:hypothetical protein
MMRGELFGEPDKLRPDLSVRVNGAAIAEAPVVVPPAAVGLYESFNEGPDVKLERRERVRSEGCSAAAKPVRKGRPKTEMGILARKRRGF